MNQTSKSNTDKQQLRAVLREIQAEEPPVSPEAQEAYFQEQVAMGERLATQGELLQLIYCPRLRTVYRCTDVQMYRCGRFWVVVAVVPTWYPCLISLPGILTGGTATHRHTVLVPGKI
jgi:import receptor subunit TOM20